MKKYTKKDREVAIQIAAYAASNLGEPTRVYAVIAIDADLAGPGLALACDAWYELWSSVTSPHWNQVLDAEVECMLREGWEP